MWIATRSPLMGEWSQAGAVAHVECMGPWFVAQDPSQWPQEEASKAAILKNFAPAERKDFLATETLDPVAMVVWVAMVQLQAVCRSLTCKRKRRS